MKIRFALLLVILAAISLGAQRLVTIQPTVVCDTTTNTQCAGVDSSGRVTVTSGAVTSTTTVMQSAAVANANGTVLAVDGQSTAFLTVNCSVCSGGTTINFEAQNDGTNFTPVYAYQVGGNALTYFTTTSGFTYWRVAVGGFKQLRARISLYSAGTVTVTGTTIPLDTGTAALNLFLGNVAASVNSGVKDTGTLRVVLATDQPALTNGLLVTPLANSSVNLNQVGGSAVSNVSGKQGVAMFDSTGTSITAVTDPCDGSLATTIPVSIAADTVMITATAAKKTYICSGLLNANGTQETVNIVEGTGAVCGTSTAALVGSTTDANGVTLAASGGGFIISRTIFGIGTNVDTCIRLGATNRVSGYLTYLQQ